MADISQIELPNGDTYDIKDSTARSDISTKQDSLIGSTISSGDLNDYTTIGHYYVNTTGASAVSNLPVALAGYLEVVQSSTSSSAGRLQRYTALSGNDIVGVYERNYNSGSWQSWKQIGEDVYLPLAGGTLTGDLSIAKETPIYYTKNTGLTINTSSNNGLSTDTTSYIIHSDSEDYYFGRFRSTAYSDGRVASVIDARNMKTNGDRVANFLAIGVNKDGSKYFNMPNDARDAFREAIKIGLNDIEPFPATNLLNGTHTTITSISPPNGTYLVIAGVSFENNTTGVRRILLSRSSSSGATPALVDSNKALIETTVPAASLNSNYTQSVSLTTIATVNNSYPTIYLRAYQNSGSTMSITGAIQYIMIA